MTDEKQNNNLSAEEKTTEETNKIAAEENFEEKTQERMEKVFNEDLSTPESEPEPEPDSTPKEPDGVPAEPEPEPDSTPKEPDGVPAEPEPEPESEPTDKNKVELPDAYYRAAIHQEWKPDEIAEFFEEKPELALKTFKKMYESTNRTSRDFAAIGRKKVESTKIVETKPVEDTFKKIDIAELKKKYPDDETIDLFEQIQAQNVELSKQIKSVTAGQSTQLDTDRETLRREIEETQRIEIEITKYFASDNLKPYNEFYGVLPKGHTSWYDGLSRQQQDNRFNVITTANYIVEGAKESGIEISASDAMNRAHLIVSESVREQILRNNLKKKAIKKEKGLTLKPKNIQRDTETKITTQSDFEKLTRQRMKKVLG